MNQWFFTYGVVSLCAFAAAEVCAQSIPVQAPAARLQEQKSAAELSKSAIHLLGPEDEVSVWVAEMTELSQNAGRTFSIDSQGMINVPMIGHVQISGLTIAQAEKLIGERFTRFIRNPQVTVSLMQVRSQPVSVIGAVITPGVHQVRGTKRLVDMLAIAGGLRPEAGPTVSITRPLENGPIPLDIAAKDPGGKFYVAEVGLEGIMKGEHPEYNFQILANDVISVPRAEMVYVVGDVMKAGGFVLNEKKAVSVLQALSLAGGLGRTASPNRSKIIRGGSKNPEQRVEVAVDLKRILSGKDKDVSMYPDDILFVPDSGAKKAALRTVEAALQAATGIAIFGTTR